MLYGFNGPQTIPGGTQGGLPPFLPGITSSAPKTPPNVNYMRQQIAGQMGSPSAGMAAPMRTMARPQRY